MTEKTPKNSQAVIDSIFQNQQSQLLARSKGFKLELQELLKKKDEITNMEIFNLKQIQGEIKDLTKASQRAVEVLEQDTISQIINYDPMKEPEPEQPEAFCKRFGVKMNYAYLRDDIGPRIDRFCWRKHAYL